ncbi:MAG: glycosyltransferase family 4 protein [Limisphaerales bacterium]
MLYVNLPFGPAHGWGVCGKYLARELSRLEPVQVITEPSAMSAVQGPLEFYELRDLLTTVGEGTMAGLLNGTQVADGPLLQGIGDERLLPRRPQIRAKVKIGYTFFERNVLRAEWIENGRRFFHRIVAGSSWCAKTLIEAGLADVAAVVQGTDPALFHPVAAGDCPRQFLLEKFVVFSGGKFELRKGQDVVIRAYKVLQDRHRDVMLLNSWFNAWLPLFQTMRHSPLIRFAPQRGSYVEVVSQVLADNGIDLQRVVTCPQQPNATIARLYHNTDVGLFPNRCEGGTNLALMEYMACGKPVLAVNTTGHADIVNAANALIIGTKGETTVNDEHDVPVARWPEPDLDDAIDKLEWAYQNRDKMRVFGQRAAKDLAERTWRKTAEAFQRIMHETGL